MSAPSDTLRIRSQLLFVEEQSGLVRLDGALMQEPVAGVPSGSPLSLLLRVPASSAVASVVEATLHRWVDRLDVVDMELVGGPDLPHVALSDGTSTVRLAVEPASLAP